MPLTQVNPGLLDTQAQYTGFKNRIINGDMRIDQRNAGASVTPTANDTYVLDRWMAGLSQSSKFSVQQNAGSVTPPAGFKNYLGTTSLSSYTVGASEQFRIEQKIEGFNVADLGWGTASAQTVTLSFWVRSSLTGTFGGAIFNYLANRCYVFSYTISSANTWEYKTITITGDTTGTWESGNQAGIRLNFSLGAGSTYSGTSGSWGSTLYFAPTGATSVVGTNGATFYITGVQLEKGSTATSFDYRPYSTELALCQRYYEKSYSQSVVPGTASSPGSILVGAPTTGLTGTTGYIIGVAKFTVVKRVAPTTILLYDEAGTVNAVTAQVIGVSSTNGNQFYVGGISDTSFQGGRDGITGTRTSAQAASFHYTASAEL